MEYCEIKSIENYSLCKNRSHIDYLFKNTKIKSISLNYEKLKQFKKFPFNNIKINLYNLKPTDVQNLNKNFETNFFVIDNQDPNNL